MNQNFQIYLIVVLVSLLVVPQVVFGRDLFKDFTETAVASVKEFFSPVGDFFSEMFNSIKNVPEVILKPFKSAPLPTPPSVEKISSPLEKNLTALEAKFKELQGKIKELEARPPKEVVKEKEVSRITKIEPTKEIIRETKVLDTQSLKEIQATLSEQEASLKKLQLAANFGFINLPSVLGPTGGTSLTTLGTITSGTWQGSTITVPYGGTGLSSVPTGYTLIGGTANSLQATSTLFISPDGKVGIGTTTPAVSLSIQGTDAILVPVGTSSQRPSGILGLIRYNTTNKTFEGYGSGGWAGLGGVIDVDQDTYIIPESSPGADEDILFFYTLGSERMRIDQNGRVGIGTSTPAATLDVLGPARFTGPTLGPEMATLYLSNTNLADTKYLIRGVSGAGEIFSVTNAGNLTVSGKGNFANLLVSDTATTTNLNVTGLTSLATTTISTQLTVPLITSLSTLTISSAGKLTASSEGNTDQLVLTTNGRVGIGTASPTSTLDVKGSTSDNTGAALNVQNLAGTSLLYVRNDGNIGIGTTTPAYKLDVAGNIRAQTSLTAGINVESLTGDKTLTPGVDKMFQFLNPNGGYRSIYLATTTANAGDKFIIKNNDSYSSYYYLTIQQGATALDYIYAGSIREYIFDGTNWVSGDVGTGISGKDYNVAIGYRAYGYNYGVAVGYNTYGSNYGTAVGMYANGNSSGAAVGYQASGYNYSAAVGSYSYGYDYGAAVGYNASGYNYGAAVGYHAFGYNYGAAVGSWARGMRYGAALGYYAGYNIDISADRYNTLVGAYSGYQLTTGTGNIIIGYKAGYDSTYSPTTGSYNILIGYNSWTPATTTSNFLNIGGLIFGTNLSNATNTISTGNVGIGTTAPAYKLDVSGNIRAQTSLTAGINVESLTGNKTLTPGVDKMFQFLNPNGGYRSIYLATTTANAGDKFIIKNNDSYSSYYYLTIQQGATVLDYIYARAVREYIFDGTNWVSGDVGTGINGSDYNVALGSEASGYNYGAAVGFGASGYNSGAAVGYLASGSALGAAVGYRASGYSSGAAVGFGADGSSYGAAVGDNAYGPSYGAAVGAYANGRNYGAAFGYFSGYQASTTLNVSVGAYSGYGSVSSYTGSQNVFVGAYSGYQISSGTGNIIIGYKAGYDSTYSPTTGSYNILIGYNSWTPATTTSNFLNIGGLIFGTNLSNATNTISTGNVGIGTTTIPWKLTVQGGICVTAGTPCPAEVAGAVAVDTGPGTAEATSSISFDIAERYPSKEVLEAGDLVVADELNPGYVKKSNQSYQPTILGIVSQKPAIAMEGSHLMLAPKEEATSTNPYIVLNGRVSVKVSLENGPIEIGDLLTSASSTPGVAMKATEPGRVIGIALEPYNREGVGKIMVFVNPHWSIGSLAENGSLATTDNQQLTTDNEQRTILDQFTLAIKKALEKLGLAIESSIAKVKELWAEKITTKQICVEGDDGETICVDKNQLKQLLQQPTTNNLQPTTNPAAEQARYGAGNSQQTTSNGATNNDVSSSTPSTTASTTTTTTTSTTASSTERTCTPNWQCQEWQPLPDTVCSGETSFTQTCRQWVDSNNCGTNETPTTTQQSTGTKDCSTSTSSTELTSTAVE